jgi:predicted aspartyl protease
MRRFVGVAFLAWALFSPSAAPAAGALPDLATVRARMDAARGATPDDYRETITATSSDGSVTTTHVYRFGKNIRTTDDEGPIHSEYGTFNGEDWVQNENGITVVDVPDPDDKPASANADSDGPGLQGTISGGDGIVISNLDANGFGTIVTVDPATYLPLRRERRSRAGVRTTAYDEYAKFGAQTLPSHWSIRDGATGAVETLVRTERVVNGAAAKDILEPGLRRPLVEFPDAKPVVLDTRFQGEAFYVHVSINGHPLYLLLDTGSSGIVLDSAAARGLGLTLINRRTVSNARASEAYDAVVSTMSLGPVSMKNIVVGATPLRNLGEIDWGFRSSGLLGFDFLATIGVTLDYQNRRVTITPASSYVPPADKYTMPIDIRLGTQQPLVSVGLDGVVANRFVVDTGNGFGSYLVFDHFMDRHPKVGERSAEAVNGEGVGGSFTAHAFYVHSFRFGTWNFTDFGGYRVGQGSYEDQTDGLLGPVFLALFSVDLDYPHGRIYLTPSADTRAMMHLK